MKQTDSRNRAAIRVARIKLEQAGNRLWAFPNYMRWIAERRTAGEDRRAEYEEELMGLAKDFADANHKLEALKHGI